MHQRRRRHRRAGFDDDDMLERPEKERAQVSRSPLLTLDTCWLEFCKHIARRRQFRIFSCRHSITGHGLSLQVENFQAARSHDDISRACLPLHGRGSRATAMRD